MNKLGNLKINKLINWITFIAFIILSIYAFRYCKQSNKYMINKIEVYGNQFTDKNIIKNLVETSITNKSIFTIDIERINKKITNNEYIKSSKVYTISPNRVLININEIKPLALFEYNNKNVFIDDKHNKITADINSINYFSVPVISIEDYNDKSIYQIVNTLKYINNKNKTLFNSINEIIIKSKFSYIIINDKTQIKLSTYNLQHETNKLIEFINNLNDKNINAYKYVNVSIPNQIIVKERKI